MAHDDESKQSRQSQPSSTPPLERAQQSQQQHPPTGPDQPQSGGGRGRSSVRQLRIGERGRQAYQEAQQLASTVEQATDEIGQFVRDRAAQRPYISLATAAGIGYILGGGVPSRLTGFLFGLGSRFAIEMFLRELIGDGGLHASAATSAANRSVS